MKFAYVLLCAVTLFPLRLAAEPIDEQFPLNEQARVLAADVESPAYRKLVDEMLITDLNAEWQRVETGDTAETFLEAHGGKETVMADAGLKAAYQRRVAIRENFLDIMRDGYKRYKKPAPFDQGAEAEKAGNHLTEQGLKPIELEVVLTAPGAEQQWPRFRGPEGQGITHTTGLPLTWSTTENVVWHTPLEGSGNSSPIVWGDRIFMTSSGEEGQRRSVLCLDRANGKLLWTRTLEDHEIEPNVREKNGFASATPVTDGQRVVAFLGSGGLVCYDFDGKQLWHHPLPVFNTTWGTGASPIIYNDLVILVHDQNKADSFMLALDKQTGEVKWEHPRERAMGWSTPLVVRVGDHDEMLYAGGETVRGYDPTTGKELWSLKGPTHEVIPTLLADRHVVYSASGRQGPTIALQPGGSGDVTETHLLWRTPRGGPHVPSPLLFEGRIYTVNDTGIATCLSAQDGKLLWQARARGKFSASPIESEGRLYCASEEGVTYVLKAGDKFEVLAENDLESPILASPAALDSRLYIRTAEGLWCIGG
ncbi:MAG TPA: PQQ-binding-like beta-propeller repeat protein [Pirellulales bacterium]|nr:PQQ-binding-like beta-propeller repeat protein [Pirellulales bacterium]